MIYLWYSSGTDVTGPALAEELSEVVGANNVDHGRDLPATQPTLLVCYGCKPGSDFNYGGLDGWSILNHPRKIRENANKLGSLEKMRNAGIRVADFFTTDQAINGLPDLGNAIYIARKKFHQGGSGLWLVMQNSDIQSAIGKGCDYFQRMVPKAQEYRVHVMNGEILFAVKKVEQENPYDSWRADREEIIRKRAETDNLTVDDGTLRLALDVCGKVMKLPDTLIRSLHRGWKFVSLGNPARAIQDAALSALRAVELDFGAVDIMKGDDNQFYVLEVNSGPGLKGQNINRYRDVIRSYYESLRRPAREERTARTTRSARTTRTQATQEPRRGGGNLAAELEGALRDVDNMDDQERRDLRRALLRIAAEL